VPANSTEDLTETITGLFEKAAPGFRDLVLSSRCVTAAQMSNYNANYVGGDIIVGGATLFAAMVGPTLRWNPWTTPIPKAYLCSSATPPGTGVHGMSGYYAARTVLKREFGLPLPSLAP
jgi:phytoene dehydrogenase-like protein